MCLTYHLSAPLYQKETRGPMIRQLYYESHKVSLFAMAVNAPFLQLARNIGLFDLYLFPETNNEHTERNWSKRDSQSCCCLLKKTFSWFWKKSLTTLLLYINHSWNMITFLDNAYGKKHPSWAQCKMQCKMRTWIAYRMKRHLKLSEKSLKFKAYISAIPSSVMISRS